MPETLHRSVVRQGAVGTPLPPVFPSFERDRVLFRTAGLSMVSGLPGNYKSTFAYNMVLQWARNGYPDGKPIVILYIAADSDKHQVGSLCAAMISGKPTTVTEQGILTGAFSRELESIASIEWEFHPLDVAQIADRMETVEQKWGKKPDLVVIDNLMNCVAGPGDWNGQIEMMRDLKTVATTTPCHVMVLHHTQEHPMKPHQVGYPPPRWDIHGKVSQFPTLILTVATSINSDTNSGIVRIATVKNRTGPDDMTASTYNEFLIQPSTGRVREIPERGVQG